MEVNFLELFNEKVNKIRDSYNNNLKKIRALGAHPSLIEDLNVLYYDSYTPLNQISNIKKQDSNTLLISPFDKTTLKNIVSSISKSNLGITASDDGNVIRVFVSPLTEEKRKEYVKKAKIISEDAKISLRNVRQEINKKIQLSKDFSEDEKKKNSNLLQNKVDEFSKEIEKILKEKTDLLMKV